MPDEKTVGIDSVFWQEWQEYQGCLYKCCLRRMGGNQTEAEDVLGAAMLRARESWRTSSKPIDNVKAWLVKLVNNLCTDLLERRDRLVFGIEDEQWVSQEEGPALAAMRQELELFFEGEVNSLPPKLRETFSLYWKEELSYREIAERSGISQDAARKRVSNARVILRERWKEYDGAAEGSTASLKKRRKSSMGESALLAGDVAGDVADDLSVREVASSRNAASCRLGGCEGEPDKKCCLSYKKMANSPARNRQKPGFLKKPGFLNLDAGEGIVQKTGFLERAAPPRLGGCEGEPDKKCCPS